jgi:hypothetical protein
VQVLPDFAPRRSLALAIGLIAVVAACGGGGVATPSIRASGSSSRPVASSLPQFSLEPSPSDVTVLTSTATPAPTPVARFSGSNAKDTARFRLTTGSYRVAWTVTATGARGCIQIAVLRSPDGKVSDEVATKTLSVAGSEKGQDHITVASSGTYYFSIASTCRWVISILPE